MGTTIIIVINGTSVQQYQLLCDRCITTVQHGTRVNDETADCERLNQFTHRA